MLLVCLLEAYHEEEAPTSEEGETEKRVVMKFPKYLAPYQVAVLPLSKKDELFNDDPTQRVYKVVENINGSYVDL